MGGLFRKFVGSQRIARVDTKFIVFETCGDVGMCLRVNVRIDTVGGSATGSSTDDGYDFVDSPLTVTFAANETEAIVVLPIVKDRVHELNETIELAITNVNGGHIGAHFELTITLVNDDDLVGDLDFDDDLDLADIDALVFSLVNAPPPDEFFFYDLNRDGLLNQTDVDRWLALAGAANLPSEEPYRRGDANLDGAVDAVDYDILNDHLFSSAPFWSQGDFNADGVIDGSDFNVWNDNKFSEVAIENAGDVRPPRAPLARDAVVDIDRFAKTNNAGKIPAAEKSLGYPRLLNTTSFRTDSFLLGDSEQPRLSRFSRSRDAKHGNSNHHETDESAVRSIDFVWASLADALLWASRNG